MHNSTSHSNQKCFQQKSGSKCKNSSTVVVDGRNSEEHENYVVNTTTVDCKPCCCSSSKAAKSNESRVKYSPPPGIRFSFYCRHPPLSDQADGFQMLVDSGSSKHFVDPKLIRGVAIRMQDYIAINPPMEMKAACHNTLFSTAQSIPLVVVCDTQDICTIVKLPIVLVPGLGRNLFSTALAI